MPQITGTTVNEVRKQLERAYIIPADTPEKVYTENLEWETYIIYRALKAYKKYVKYPLEITVLDDRPKGRYCVYSTIDGEILDGYSAGIEKQYIYICPHNLICPFRGARVTVSRITEDIHSFYKSKACKEQKIYQSPTKK